MNKLISVANIEHVDTIGGAEYHVGILLVGTLLGKSVVITKAGIGKVRASSGVTTLLNTYNISKLIFTGINGCP